MTHHDEAARAPWRALAAGLLIATLAACGGGQTEGASAPGAAPETAQPPARMALAAMDQAAGSAADAIIAAATGPGSVAWVNPPGGVAVATDAADHVYTATWDYNPAGDIYLAKRDRAGVLLWQTRYDNTDPTRHEVATWVGTDSQGNALVSGIIRSGYSDPVNANSVLMKFAPDGRLLWRRVYDAFFDGSSTRKLLVDAGDNIYVLGLGMSANGLRTTVRKFAADGSTLWAWFDGSGIGLPVNFKWTGDGAIVIAARAQVGAINGYAKIDRDGRTLWSLPGLYSLTVGDAAGDAAGNSYLINGNYATGSGSVLRKVGPTAATLWERSTSIAGMRVEAAADGSAVVAGFPDTGTAGAALVKFGAGGQLLWANLDADGPDVALLAHAQLRLDAQDNAYLAGSTMQLMGVTKVFANGGSGWTALLPSGYAYALAFGSDGAVYVTGGTTGRIENGPADPPPPPPTPSADLALALADSPDPVRSGSDLTLLATVSNKGPWAATLVNLAIDLPAGYTLRSITSTQGACSGSSTIRCAIGSLASGAQAQVAVTVRSKVRGTLTTTASVTAAEPDPTPANNVASQSTTVVKR